MMGAFFLIAFNASKISDDFKEKIPISIYLKNNAKNFLNSFFSNKFSLNRVPQMKNLKKFVNNLNHDKNIIFVTHYVVISESLNYAPSSGEIVVSNKDFKVIDTIEIEY